MQPIKVLILITKSNWGGAQRYVYDLATGLSPEKYRVKVMAGGDGELIRRLAAVGISADGTLPIGRDVSVAEDLRAFFRLWGILKRDRPDILHVNSSKIGGLGALAGRLARVPRIVFTAHGWAFNEDRDWASKLLIRLAYWATLVLSHTTIAVSEAARRQVRGWPFTGDKISVVHNGTAADASYSKANARFTLSDMSSSLKTFRGSVAESQQVWVGTIAELHPIKGYPYALKAIRRAVDELARIGSKKRLMYIIMGTGQETARIEALITELGLHDHVVMLGHVPHASQYLKAFDVFILASLSEGLSYVLLEAGASQVAVVATAVGGIPEIVSDMESGVLVQPANDRELSHALMFMVEHPTERKRYAAALKERVAAEFSLEQMIKETERAYGTHTR